MLEFLNRQIPVNTRKKRPISAWTPHSESTTAPLYKQAAGINIFKAEHRNSLKYTDLATMEVFPIKEALTFVQYYFYISQLIKPEVSGPKIPYLKYYE